MEAPRPLAGREETRAHPRALAAVFAGRRALVLALERGRIGGAQADVRAHGLERAAEPIVAAAVEPDAEGRVVAEVGLDRRLDPQAGQLVQMIVEEIEGQETATAALTEKLRAHAIVVDSSSWKQKKSQGTFGTVIYRPFAIAQLIGA